MTINDLIKVTSLCLLIKLPDVIDDLARGADLVQLQARGLIVVKSDESAAEPEGETSPSVQPFGHVTARAAGTLGRFIH